VANHTQLTLQLSDDVVVAIVTAAAQIIVGILTAAAAIIAALIVRSR
jgi:hypothetical protein